MSTSWRDYQAGYRNAEIQRIHKALRAGDCMAVIGLSGAGKSNLAGFLAHSAPAELPMRLLDCNQLATPTRDGLFSALAAAIDSAPRGADMLTAADAAVSAFLKEQPRLCLVLDRFDALPVTQRTITDPGRALLSNLRALRDRHKFKLTYVVTLRRALARDSELAELFYANTLWLGPLNDDDARWNIVRFAARRDERWDEQTQTAILRVSQNYPSLLKAACEAVADGCALDALAGHDAIQRRVEEFWSDQPSDDELTRSGLKGHALLTRASTPSFDAATLTAKEHLLLRYFQEHANAVCDKDELIKAVWSEDKAFVKGIRDDSLAQLVRRLREKIEADPSAPKHILAVPGRGYRYKA
jgi:energy-coupling factor transporter ATP-binding protein EcfA2